MAQQQSPQRRKLHLLKTEIGLTELEVIELARYLLRRDINSTKDLSDDQVLRMLDALEGHTLVVELLRQRP